MKTSAVSAFDRIASREIKNLTDVFSERRTVLEDLLEIMPSNHRLGPQLRQMLHNLYQHEILQRELPLRFVQQNSDKASK